MNVDTYINTAISRGVKLGLDKLSATERIIFLISKLEVSCDIDGIDSFLDRYPHTRVVECVHGLEAIGASELAGALSAVAEALPQRPDALLNEANDLATSRTGYDYDAIARWVEANSKVAIKPKHSVPLAPRTTPKTPTAKG